MEQTIQKTAKIPNPELKTSSFTQQYFLVTKHNLQDDF